MPQTTAPHGFRNNYAALVYLVRFGFELWTPEEMAVLLFHAERSTLYGWESDQHSQAQAQNGIYSRKRGQWIRGGAGVSRATWNRVNARLSVDDAHAADPKRVIRRARRHDGQGGNAPTQYALDWFLVRKAISAHIEAKTAEIAPLLQAAGAAGEGEGLSQGETRGGLFVSQGVVSQGDKGLSHGETHIGESDNQDSITEMGKSTGAAVRAALEAIFGAEPENATDRLLQIAMKLRLPEELLVAWMHDFDSEKREKRYAFTPGLMLQAAGTGLIPWLHRGRGRLVLEQWNREQVRLARAGRPAQVVELPRAVREGARKPAPAEQRGLPLAEYSRGVVATAAAAVGARGKPAKEVCPVCGERAVVDGVCGWCDVLRRAHAAG